MCSSSRLRSWSCGSSSGGTPTAAPAAAETSRAHKGAGIEFHLTVPGEDIGTVYEAHRRHAESVTGLATQPWGELAFHAVLLGYRFLIAAEGAELS